MLYVVSHVNDDDDSFCLTSLLISVMISVCVCVCVCLWSFKSLLMSQMMSDYFRLNFGVLAGIYRY